MPQRHHSPSLLAVLALGVMVVTADAQPVAAPDAGGSVPVMEERLQRTVGELETLLEQRGMARERAVALAAEIDSIRRDKADVTAALVAAAKAEKKLAAGIAETETRLADLETRATGIRASLSERKALLAEVLAALQRMGLNPPPAILVRPDDALASVRSAILLGAVVPGIRTETEILAADLAELASVTSAIADERTRLTAARDSQLEEQARLAILVEEKQELEGRTAEALAAEQKRFAELAMQAESMQGLIESLEQEISAARQEAERARLAAEEAERLARQAREEAERAAAEAERLAREQQETAEREAREEAERIAAQQLALAREAEENARRRLDESRARAEELAARQTAIAPAQAFSSLRGALARPVSGRTITAFGQEDGLGGLARGDTIETRADAIVTAPADGKVLYAGPFRAYGNLLIMDAGDGYHVVLAGLDRIDVSPGQYVVASEPVGIMGRIRLAGVTAAAAENDSPTLYVEFRKDGKPVNPAPWWEPVTTGRI